MGRFSGAIAGARPTSSLDAPTPPPPARRFPSVARPGIVRLFEDTELRLAIRCARRRKSLLVIALVDAPQFVRGGAFSGNSPDAANQCAELFRCNVFTEIRACRFRNVLFHECAAEIIGAGFEG